MVVLNGHWVLVSPKNVRELEMCPGLCEMGSVPMLGHMNWATSVILDLGDHKHLYTKVKDLEASDGH